MAHPFVYMGYKMPAGDYDVIMATGDGVLKFGLQRVR
jgi:hypothetical protein